ncbi:MAG: CBS domain-containing protein [Deltaproteobacteria bacterium]|jgi:CBS domain-containing protein|nr:CBS domain-containing protein [Deltaproteobacteria bacterium]
MTQASDSMTRKVIVAQPEITLRDAWTLMSREDFRHLPVVSGGTLLGILSDRDILIRAHQKGDELLVPDTPVGEAATPWPFVCEPDTDVRQLVHTMIDKKIDAVPVIDGANQLIGLVTSTDLMLLLLGPDELKMPLPFLFELEEYQASAA